MNPTSNGYGGHDDNGGDDDNGGHYGDTFPQRLIR